MKKGQCKLCDRTAFLTKHHLLPRGEKSKNNLKRDDIAWLCIDCSRQIHAFFTRDELTKKYYTIDLLLTNNRVKEYVAWIRTRKIKHLHPSMKQ